MYDDELFEDTGEMNEDTDLSGKKPIHFVSKDPDIEGLHKQYIKGRLLIQPDYQRNFVWDMKKASLLIESMLINIPIPIIYFAETQDNKMNVIDGQQRLTSIFSFVDGMFPDGREFKLSKLQVRTDLSGKKFKELDEEDQNKILDYSIRTITFLSDSDPELQYEIFRRLNTGAVALNAQELRNCVYRGKFNEFIKRLAKNEDYLKLLGLKEPHKRMADVEKVLRFISFYEKTYINYKSPIKTFLNDTMRDYQDITDEKMKEIEQAFKRAVTNLTSLLGEKSFKRYKLNDNNEGEWDKNKLNASLFDILMDSMARYDTPVIMGHLDSIYEAYINLMVTDDEFVDSITKSTSDEKVVKKRFTIWNDLLECIIKTKKADERCFSFELKKELYDNNPTCSICGQHINSIDDSAVDHIEQYWMGGKTIPENARLAHRYCNNARARKE